METKTVTDVERFLAKPSTVTCTWCKGKGSYVEEGFDGRTRMKCTDCKGTGKVRSASISQEEKAA